MITLAAQWCFLFESMKFEFSIGGYSGPSLHVKLDGNYLLCSTIAEIEQFNIEQRISIHENEKWGQLLQFLSTRNWKGEYINHDILDGTSWELMVETNAFNIDCCGSNAYPKGFKKFLKLLNNITSEAGMEVY
jgi:hypothetical protein